ncbi:phage tail protein I [Marinomonas transparens]|uniref:Phage tail protein I n=1 Tax=Marinomonas transparens TaxID=2795388 RepID=A0A934JTY4_9GAMM|nr:phage tail protein I [Marinomonas transparens]MBJ7539898.1 phage tail protein I [Marinomonas transparens]
MTQSKLPSGLKAYSVLPDNRSPLERALELALSESLYSIDHPFPELLNAQSTTVEAVAPLGIDHQVPVWDREDSEAVKRDRVEHAWRNRQKSGTRSGFLDSLQQMGFGSEVTPWFKLSPVAAPYFFQVWVYCSDRVLTPEINTRIDELLIEMKSERDTYELNLARESIATPKMAVAAEIGVTITSYPYSPEGGDSTSLNFIGTAQHLRIISTSEPAYNERL